MMRPTRDAAGDTLVEIVIAVVLIGIITGGFFTAITTTAAASRAHRDMATADTILRDYAEHAKQAVRITCVTGNPGPPSVSYTPPTGYNVTATDLTCPAAGSVNMVHISTTTPTGLARALDIEVRAP